MKRKIALALLISMLGLLVACNKEKEVEEPITEAPELFKLEATFTAAEKVDVGETVELNTIVTQGEEKVDAADEVVYEVWEEGKKATSEMIDAVNEGDGVYTAETTFEHDGLFHIQVHVTANAQHTMPLIEVTVGEGGQYEEVAEADEVDHEQTAGFSMHFMKPDGVTAGEETKFVVHIELDKEALEKAKVRYEIWNKASEAAHDWVNTTEETAGEYSAMHTFDEAGVYTIQIHVENDDGLHEHEEYDIEVK